MQYFSTIARLQNYKNFEIEARNLKNRLYLVNIADEFLKATKQILLSLGILITKAQQENSMGLDLVEHVLSEQQLAQNERGLVLEVESLGLLEQLLLHIDVGKSARRLLLLLHELIEQVGALLRAAVERRRSGELVLQLLQA